MNQPHPSAPATLDPSALGNSLELAVDDVPSEFTLSLVSDEHNQTAVLLGFGHLRWRFTPDLAATLGEALVDAATRARVTPVPASTAEPGR